MVLGEIGRGTGVVDAHEAKGKRGIPMTLNKDAINVIKTRPKACPASS
jgi:hypothetical protein